MKKILLAIAAVLCMSTFVACNPGTSDAAQTDTDTIVAVDSVAVDSVVVDSMPADSVCCTCMTE